MDFSTLAAPHSKIDKARCSVIDAYCLLAEAATLAHDAGNTALAKQIIALGHKALALDFTIPHPKR